MSPTEDEEPFRAEVRQFLEANLTDEMRRAAEHGFGVSREISAIWHRKLFEQGWVAPGWPVAHGGTGWSLEQCHVFETELALAGAPMLMPFGLSMVGPVLYTFGTDEQKSQHLPGILDGSVWWCQGYSEPGSGSDLASLKTAAVRDGDEYVVNGQKIWTTNAHKADWIFCLVRTDPDSKPQRGISFLLIDMNTPGIEVRPIISIDGLHHLNEVYFTDVRVPIGNRIGEENEGWTYAKFLLGHERTSISGVSGSKRNLEALARIAAEEAPGGEGEPLIDSPAFARRLGDVGVALDALETLEARVLAEFARGGNPGDQASLLKILGTEIMQMLETLRVEAAAYYALPFDRALISGEAEGEAPGPEFALRAVADYNFGRAHTIYGGSNEIQRNVIAKAVLGL